MAGACDRIRAILPVAILAASIEPVQDGRIHIEKINAPFLYTLKASGPEFGAGIESRTYVRLLAPGKGPAEVLV